MAWLNARMSQPQMVTEEEALEGRDTPVLDPMPTHQVLGLPLDEVPEGAEAAYFALGCFWGEERMFWQVDGVLNTAVGYMGGFTPNPTYEETCTGHTGHTETVKVVYDPAKVSYDDLLTLFWENHDPTQVYRQGNDLGTQYRSAIFPVDEGQRQAAERSRDAFQERLTAEEYGPISTEITMDQLFYYAEDEHQQYLSKNPGGYCGLGGTGVSCPVGIAG